MGGFLDGIDFIDYYRRMDYYRLNINISSEGNKNLF